MIGSLSFKSPALSVLFGVVLLAGCGGTPGRAGSQKANAGAQARLHMPGQISMFTQPEAGTRPVVQAIDGAQKSVWLQIYMLTDPAVINALGRASARGIDVRVLLEEKPYTPAAPGGGTNPSTQRTAATLETSGVKVAWTNPRFNFTHAKSMLVDGRVAYVLSYNLTKAATHENREFGVINAAQSDVEELKRIFIADWNRQPYQPLDPDLVISPNNARMRILGIISSAQRELLVGVEVISDPEVVSALMHKKAEGLDVRVLVGGIKKVPANIPAAKALINGGVPTRSQGRPYLHAKYIIADGAACYLGSINFSTNSMDNNREIGLMLADPAAIATLRATFDRDWPKAEAIPGDAPAPTPMPVVPPGADVPVVPDPEQPPVLEPAVPEPAVPEPTVPEPVIPATP